MIICISIVCLSYDTYAQRGKNCYFSDDQHKSESQIIDSVLSDYNENEILHSRSKSYIQVVFHIVWKDASQNISESLLNSQIDVLNKSFSAENDDIHNIPSEFKNDIGKLDVQFCLARTDPDGQSCSGIIRIKTDIDQIGLKDQLFYTSSGGSDAWDTDQYLNIWVADTGNTFSGFGSYPGEVEKERIGVVIHPDFIGVNDKHHYGLGRTLVHEIGHYFGLKHLWGDDNNCDSDDGVYDTPLQKQAHYRCPNYPQSGCSSSEMYMNYMDYVDDNCMVFFTIGQMKRIMEVIHLYRPNLLKSVSECNELPVDIIKVFPNPCIDEIYIEGHLKSFTVPDICVYNIAGIKLNVPVEENNKNYIIHMSKQSTGMYFIKINEKIIKIVKL